MTKELELIDHCQGWLDVLLSNYLTSLENTSLTMCVCVCNVSNLLNNKVSTQNYDFYVYVL